MFVSLFQYSLKKSLGNAQIGILILIFGLVSPSVSYWSLPRVEGQRRKQEKQKVYDESDEADILLSLSFRAFFLCLRLSVLAAVADQLQARRFQSLCLVRSSFLPDKRVILKEESDNDYHQQYVIVFKYRYRFAVKHFVGLVRTGV